MKTITLLKTKFTNALDEILDESFYNLVTSEDYQLAVLSFILLVGIPLLFILL